MNVFDYLHWRGDIPFKAAPFNEVDNVILSQLPYLDWHGAVGKRPVPFEKAWEAYQRLHGSEPRKPGGLTQHREQITGQALASARFHDMMLQDYVYDLKPEEEKQFCAMTFKLPDGTYFVSYEGTDATLVGWKENFNMSFLCPVPAQQEAADYLAQLSQDHPFRFFRVGGHSKGGNLAYYAAVALGKPDQILVVYSDDGPGFSEAFVQSAPYQQIAGKMVTFMPQSSIVGKLLNNDSHIQNILSDSRDYLWQHDVFTWQVDVDKLVRVEDPTLSSKFIQEALNGWNNEMTFEEKMVFMNTVYDALTETGIDTLHDIDGHRMEITRKLMGSLSQFSDSTRDILTKVVALLFQSNLRSFKDHYIDGFLNSFKK